MIILIMKVKKVRTMKIFNNNTDNDAKESDENTDEIINQLVDKKKK